MVGCSLTSSDGVRARQVVKRKIKDSLKGQRHRMSCVCEVGAVSDHNEIVSLNYVALHCYGEGSAAYCGC